MNGPKSEELTKISGIEWPLLIRIKYAVQFYKYNRYRYLKHEFLTYSHFDMNFMGLTKLELV